MRMVKWGGFLILSLFLIACGGYTARVYPPVQVPNALTKVASSPNYAVADHKSFASAFIPYPTRNNNSNHSIPVGDYLLSRVVLALPQKSGINTIALKAYDNNCASRGVFGPHLWCVYRLSVDIIQDGKKRNLLAKGEVDVGPKFIPGDVSPPFTFGNRLVRVIHFQARRAVDAAVKQLAATYRTGGP